MTCVDLQGPAVHDMQPLCQLDQSYSAGFQMYKLFDALLLGPSTVVFRGFMHPEISCCRVFFVLAHVLDGQKLIA